MRIDPKFWAVEKNFVRRFFPENATFGAGNPHFGEFKGKIEILSSRNLFVGNLQLSVKILQFPAPTFQSI